MTESTDTSGRHSAPEPSEPAPTDVPAPEQSQPVDAPYEPTAAHPENEDPEQHLGEVTDDPWDDDSQTDWPNGSVNLPGVNS